jgi:hypothetical protein
LVASLGDDAFIIKSRKNGCPFLPDEIKTILVIWKLNEAPLNSLCLVLNLLELENKLIELLLKSLILRTEKIKK